MGRREAEQCVLETWKPKKVAQVAHNEKESLGMGIPT